MTLDDPTDDRATAAPDPASGGPGSQTALAVAALSFSGRRLADLPDLVRALGHVKAAAAQANRVACVLDEDEAAAIEAAALSLAAGHLDATLVADPLAGGGAIAVHVNVNEALADVANRSLDRAPGTDGALDPKGSIGASQSTADVVHAAARLAVLDATERLLATTAHLAGAIDAVADRAGDSPTLARTCLQDGLAVDARLLFDGSAAAIRRAADAISAATEPLWVVVLGGTVVGTGDGAPAAYRSAVVPALGAVTGRDLVGDPLPASRLQHADDLVAVVEGVARLSGVAAKLARDLRLLSSGPRGGFGEVQLPAVMEGSSFFVGKVNPAVPESVVQANLQVIGCRAVATAAAQEAELHLHGYDLTAAVAALDAATVLDVALDRFAHHCLAGLTFDEERGRELAGYAAPSNASEPKPVAPPIESPDRRPTPASPWAATDGADPSPSTNRPAPTRERGLR